jgi:hypothetical protein
MEDVTLAADEQLPALPFWAARSTYAAIVTAVASIAAVLNVDLFARFGTTEAGVLALVDAALPLLGLIWLWFERRNPHYRIGV